MKKMRYKNNIYLFSIKSILTIIVTLVYSPLLHQCSTPSYISTFSSFSYINQWMINLPAIFLKTPCSWLSSMMENIPPKHRLLNLAQIMK